MKDKERKHCGKPLNKSQYRQNKSYKSCPRCSIEDGKEHIYYIYPTVQHHYVHLQAVLKELKIIAKLAAEILRHYIQDTKNVLKSIFFTPFIALNVGASTSIYSLK